MHIILMVKEGHALTRNSFYLSNVGVSYEAETVGRDEVEHHLVARYQGLTPNVDYIFQTAYPKTIWQLNGITPLGARAVASVSRGFNFRPNRIDIGFQHITQAIGQRLDFDTCCQILAMWFRKHKPTTAIHYVTTAAGTGRMTVGARTARFSLVVEEIVEGPIVGTNLQWRVRQNNVEPVWAYLNFFHDETDFYKCCSDAFAACTNSLLEPDFFGLGHNKDVFMLRDKPDVEAQDWYGYLAGVAGKIVSEAKKQKSMHLTEDSIDFLTREVGKAVVKIAEKESEIVRRLDSAAQSVVLSK